MSTICCLSVKSLSNWHKRKLEKKKQFYEAIKNVFLLQLFVEWVNLLKWAAPAPSRKEFATELFLY